MRVPEIERAHRTGRPTRHDGSPKPIERLSVSLPVTRQRNRFSREQEESTSLKTWPKKPWKREEPSYLS